MTAIAILALATTASAQTYSVGTSAQGTLGNGIGAAVAKVVTEETDVRLRVVPQGGPTVTLPLVGSGELEFAISTSVASAFAYMGREDFDGRPQRDLRAAATLVPLYAGIIVAKDSGINQLTELKGKRLATRFTAFRINDQFTRAMLATVGMTYDDIVEVPAPTGPRGMDDLIAGRVDGASFSIGAPKTMEADVALGGIRILPLPDTEAARKAMQEVTPGATIIRVEPAPHRVGVERTTPMLASAFILNASASVPDEVIYRIVEVLYKNKPKLEATLKSFADYDPANIALDVLTPFHAGAEKFFREHGLM